MTVTATSGASSTSPYTSEKSGFASLGQQDFFRLMTTQMQMQDPFDPVDNKEMLAQMAQFSSLAGISTMGDTLTSIADKLDALLSAQTAAAATQNSTETTDSQADASTGDTPTTQS